MRLRRQLGRALLGLCAGAAIGWAVSARASGAPGAPPFVGAPAIGGGVVCALGRACIGSAGCAGECDDATSLISGCARCEKGVYAGCSEGVCQPAMEFVVAAANEAVCPNQLMTPCPTAGEMCTIGRTSHRCRCTHVGSAYLKWVCK